MQTLPVYVISLNSATHRRAAIEQHLGTLGIQYEIFDAVKGNALQPDYLQEINPGRNMSAAQIGCYLSHIRLYERILTEKTPVALILEDDTVLNSSVKDLVTEGCQSLDFDYCFLGSDDNGDAGFVFYEPAAQLKLSDQHLAFPLSDGPYCLNAYLITQEGAKKRLSCAYPARSAIDHYHHLPYRPRFLAIVPMIAFVNELSAVQSMSSLNWSGLQTVARRHWWYYPLRDMLTLKSFRKLLALRRALQPNTGRWRAFESAFRVVRPSRLTTRKAGN